MSDDISPELLRAVAREHFAVMQPGGILVVRVPADWGLWEVRDLQGALTSMAEDPARGLGIKVLVVPAEGISVAQPPPDPVGA
jgi:hypothetical protein